MYCLDIILNGVAFILKIVPIVSALLSLHAKATSVTRPGVSGDTLLQEWMRTMLTLPEMVIAATEVRRGPP